MSTQEPTGPAGEAGQPSEEELRQALEEQMRRISVDDVLVQTVVTLVNLSGRRLGLGLPPEQQEEKDLAQAYQAIEAVRVLLPLLPDDAVAPIKDAIAQLQMAYAREAGGGQAGQEGAGDQPGEPGSQQPQEAQGDPAADRREEEQRAKARSKLWTPPGA